VKIRGQKLYKANKNAVLRMRIRDRLENHFFTSAIFSSLGGFQKYITTAIA
jgi:hypothetical protein